MNHVGRLRELFPGGVRDETGERSASVVNIFPRKLYHLREKRFAELVVHGVNHLKLFTDEYEYETIEK